MADIHKLTPEKRLENAVNAIYQAERTSLNKQAIKSAIRTLLNVDSDLNGMKTLCSEMGRAEA